MKVDKNFHGVGIGPLSKILAVKCQIDGEDFVNFCGLLRKHELYFWELYSIAVFFKVKEVSILSNLHFLHFIIFPINLGWFIVCTYFNTQYMTNPTIVYPVKMEYGWKGLFNLCPACIVEGGFLLLTFRIFHFDRVSDSRMAHALHRC